VAEVAGVRVPCEGEEKVIVAMKQDTGNRRCKVLVLSRSYPNDVLSGLGLWVKRLVQQCAETTPLKVISPVPYCPPLFGFPEYTKFRRVARQNSEDGVEVFHPRFVVGPGQRFYPGEALSYYVGTRRQADRIKRTFDFNIIHAHFSYPDGVAAVLLGRRYGVPVVVTEHAPWMPNWMDKSAVIRRQSVWAAKRAVFQIAVSGSVRDTIAHFTRDPGKIRVIHCGVDGAAFGLQPEPRIRRQDQVLFVGFINLNKGIDVLLDAMRLVVARRPSAKLVLVGGAFYRNSRQQEQTLRALAMDLEQSGHLEFVGHQPPDEVARYMRESALLVLPSRAESFGAVLVEALACGTPVVATKCGGPEDIVKDEVGMLVPPEDSRALAAAIEHVMANGFDYDPATLRAYALENFSWGRIAQQTTDLYHEAISLFQNSVTAQNGPEYRREYGGA
jgi:teichuronic acid biosynthesis glycosyltransferase TuaC